MHFVALFTLFLKWQFVLINTWGVSYYILPLKSI